MLEAALMLALLCALATQKAGRWVAAVAAGVQLLFQVPPWQHPQPFLLLPALKLSFFRHAVLALPAYCWDAHSAAECAWLM